MTRKEFNERMAQIDPESEDAVDELASLFEEDYLTAGRDLNDPAVIEDILLVHRTVSLYSSWGVFQNTVYDYGK